MPPKEIVRARTEMRLSQAELGQLLNVHLMTVNKWESGKASPNHIQIVLLNELGKAAKIERIREEFRVAMAMKSLGDLWYWIMASTREPATFAQSKRRRHA